MKEVLYFIAIIPDEKLQQTVQQLKLEISKEYSTYHALKSPPHITIQRPFKRDQNFEEIIIPALIEFSAHQAAFNVLLKGYGAFEPKVLYINIDEHEPFKAIHSKLNSVLKDQLNFPDKELNTSIHPHLTLAHRDLDEKNFRRAWHRFKNYKFEANFQAKQICLLKHNGQHWDIYRKFDMNSMR